MQQSELLITGFLESLARFPEKPAVFVNNVFYTYEKLAQIAGQIKDILNQEKGQVAVLAKRSISAYAGILGVLASGNAYVPLNPKYPVKRSKFMVGAAECKQIIVGSECLSYLEELLPHLEAGKIIVFPDTNQFSVERFSEHRFIFQRQLETLGNEPLKIPNETNELAYIIFTSGCCSQRRRNPRCW